MSESRINLVDRLRDEQRWGEASAFKDTVVKELRSKGVKRTEAVEEAWRRLAVEYPPLPPKADPEPEHGDDVAEQKPAGRVVGPTVLPADWGELAESAPFEVEVEWVHQNRVLVVEERSGTASALHWDRARKPAPSYGAVNLMEFAATNRKGFMDILHRVKSASEDPEEEGVKREKFRIEEIEALLEKLREDSNEELRANTPQVIRDRVNSLLDGWGRQFGLTTPADARADLAAHVGHLVTEAVDALAPA